MSDDDYRAQLVINIEEYNKYNFYGTIISVTLVIHVFTKQLFNVFAEIKMPYDKWTIIDTATAVLNLLCFNIIGGATPD